MCWLYTTTRTNPLPRPARYDMLALAKKPAPLRLPVQVIASGQPAFSLPGSPQHPSCFYLCRRRLPGACSMVALMVANGEEIPPYPRWAETDMAEGLKSMALAGHGLAFCPDSAVGGEAERGCWRWSATPAGN